MDGLSNGQKVTMSMELLKEEREPLFLIHANNLVLGNYKYGSFEKSLSINNAPAGKQIKPKLFEISCLEVADEYEPYPDGMSFYNYQGQFGLGEIAIARPLWLLRQTAFLREADLLGTHTIFKYSPTMRRWARSRFTHVGSIAENLCDVTTFKLLNHDYLSFHAAAFEIDGKAYLLTGLPDTGKTYTTIQFISQGANFMSEDIVLVDEKVNAVGMPFTATMEKRKNVPLPTRIKAKTFQFFFQQNYSKQTFFDTSIYNGHNVSSRAPIAGIFFLKKGKSGYRQADKKEMLRHLINLNRLEFTYWRNVGILAYIFFEGSSSIDDYLNKEAKMLEKLVENVPIYEVLAPDHTGFASAIEPLLNELQK